MIYSARRLFCLLFFAVLSAGATIAHAEGGCPPGQYPQSGQGWQTCVPIPGSVGGASAPAGVAPLMSKYGAIVGDPGAGVIGTSAEQVSQDIAEQKAMSDCKAKGGQKCELAIAYGNKCVSLVSGDSFYNIQTGLTLREAESNAMRSCSDKNCRVLYSDCSNASRY